MIFCDETLGDIFQNSCRQQINNPVSSFTIKSWFVISWIILIIMIMYRMSLNFKWWGNMLCFLVELNTILANYKLCGLILHHSTMYTVNSYLFSETVISCLVWLLLVIGLLKISKVSVKSCSS